MTPVGRHVRDDVVLVLAQPDRHFIEKRDDFGAPVLSPDAEKMPAQ
ncbi:hypothetical protein [Burkholderia sp. WAC0059]|nr:hypothetical protein [Burkholderia sp. WAC0059]